MAPRNVRVRLKVAGLGIVFLAQSSLLDSVFAQARNAPENSPIIYQKSRQFRVPFTLKPEDAGRRKELQLWSSTDQGKSWAQRGATTPDRPAFTFDAPGDDEYWLAIRSIDQQGNSFPPEDSPIVPSMKVAVDTTPPTVKLELQVRSASLVSVRWEIQEDHIDAAKNPTLEYQLEGSSDWRPVPDVEKGLTGAAMWDTGTADPLKVRASVQDRAGNRTVEQLQIGANQPEGAAPASNVNSPTTRPESATEAKPKDALPLEAQPDNNKAVTPPSETPGSAPPTERAAESSASESGTIPKLDRPPQVSPGPDAPEVSPRVDPSRRDLPQRPTGPETTLTRPRSTSENGTTVEQSTTPRGSQVLASPQQASRSILASPQQAMSYAPTPIPLESLKPGEPQSTAEAQPRDVPPFTRRSGAGSVDHSSYEAMMAQRQPGVGESKDPAYRAERELTVSRVASRGENRIPQEHPPEIPQDPIQSSVAHRQDTPLASEAGRGFTTVPTNQTEAPVLKVASPRFLLDYAVDRPGPDGNAEVVELWVTRDGGTTWAKAGTDPDRKSPFMVELAGPGVHGLSLIARDALGFGDQPPAPGDQPKMWIQVESGPEMSNAPAANGSAVRR